jgi:hypothetical protein
LIQVKQFASFVSTHSLISIARDNVFYELVGAGPFVWSKPRNAYPAYWAPFCGRGRRSDAVVRSVPLTAADERLRRDA